MCGRRFVSRWLARPPMSAWLRSRLVCRGRRAAGRKPPHSVSAGLSRLPDRLGRARGGRRTLAVRPGVGRHHSGRYQDGQPPAGREPPVWPRQVRSTWVAGHLGSVGWDRHRLCGARVRRATRPGPCPGGGGSAGGSRTWLHWFRDPARDHELLCGGVAGRGCGRGIAGGQGGALLVHDAPGTARALSGAGRQRLAPPLGRALLAGCTGRRGGQRSGRAAAGSGGRHGGGGHDRSRGIAHGVGCGAAPDGRSRRAGRSGDL